jgi:hypothetical protein
LISFVVASLNYEAICLMVMSLSFLFSLLSATLIGLLLSGKVNKIYIYDGSIYNPRETAIKIAIWLLKKLANKHESEYMATIKAIELAE